MRSDALRVTAMGFSVMAFSVMSPRTPTPDERAGDAGRGKAVYERYCTQCHGARGDGAGEVAPFVTPRPRDFRQGLFKFRSTPLGALPLVSDLDRTISNGLYGTAMPPFDALNPRARLDVIAYIQTFSRRWRTDAPATPMTVPPEPTPTQESVTRGQMLFNTSCASCHGDGSGNGPLAKSVVDAWGYADPPADLTKGRTKSEVDGRDIYLRLMTGINGTPMPGFAGALTTDQAWDIVHFVESLGPWKQSTVRLRTPAMDSAAAAPHGIGGGTAAPITGKTIDVKMVGDEKGYRFEPATITLKAGDGVRVTNVVGGPHNITFWPDSIPSGAQQQLQANMPNTSGPLTSPLLIKPSDSYTISFAGVAPGTYKFYCMPHLALGMKGQIIVQ